MIVMRLVHRPDNLLPLGQTPTQYAARSRAIALMAQRGSTPGPGYRPQVYRRRRPPSAFLATRRPSAPPVLDPVERARRVAAERETNRRLALASRPRPTAADARRRRSQRLQAFMREREQAKRLRERQALVEAERARSAMVIMPEAAAPLTIFAPDDIIDQVRAPGAVPRIEIPTPWLDVGYRTAQARERLGIRGIYG